MKICPSCSSTAFDDMPVCFGCLQPFDTCDPFPFLEEMEDFEDDWMLEEPTLE